MPVKLIFTLFSFLFAANLIAQTNWQLKKDKNGIKVYTGNLDSSKYKAIKAECVIEGTFLKLIAVIKDIDHHVNWVYSTKKAYLVTNINDTELIYYAETSLPWPVNNRDVVIRMSINNDSAANKLEIITRGEQNIIPEKKGIVRIPYFNARYEITSIGDNKLRVNYYLKTDPGGTLPPWIVNMFAVKGPYETFSALAGLLKKNQAATRF